jgi:hypothetical protein
MKKIISLLVCVLFVLGLSACTLEFNKGGNVEDVLKTEKLEQENKGLEEEKEKLQEELDRLKEEQGSFPRVEEEETFPRVEDEELNASEEELKEKLEDALEEQRKKEQELEEVEKVEDSDALMLHYIKNGKYVKEETTYDSDDTLKVSKAIGKKYNLSGVISSIQRTGDNYETVTIDFQDIDLSDEKNSDYLTSLAVTFILEFGAEEVYYSYNEELTTMFNPDGLYMTKNILNTNWSEIMPGE